METATLKLATLHLVPGLAEDFDQQIESLVADCLKRPGLAKDRVLKVEVRIRPHKADPQDVTIEPVIATKRPSTSIDPIRGRCTKRNQLQFDWSADGGGSVRGMMYDLANVLADRAAGHTTTAAADTRVAA